MASFWPTDAGRATSATFADSLNHGAKIVFSKTLREASWQNTTIVRDISAHAIHKLKDEATGDLMIFGSGSIVAQLTKLGLIDEYQFMLTPVILGGGKTLFEGIDRSGLRLTDSHVFECGVVMLTYVPDELRTSRHP
jgi:dihydrofolate reductase